MEDFTPTSDARMLAISTADTPSPRMSGHSPASSTSAGSTRSSLSTYSPLTSSTNMFEGPSAVWQSNTMGKLESRSANHSAASSYSSRRSMRQASRSNPLRTSVHLQMPPDFEDEDGDNSDTLNGTTVFPEASTSSGISSHASASMLSIFQRRRTRISPSSPGSGLTTFARKTQHGPVIHTTQSLNDLKTRDKGKERLDAHSATLSTIPSPLWSPISTTKSSPASSISSRIFSPALLSSGATSKQMRSHKQTNLHHNTLFTRHKSLLRDAYRQPSLRMLVILFLAAVTLLLFFTKHIISHRTPNRPSALHTFASISDSIQAMAAHASLQSSSHHFDDRPDLDTLAIYRIIGNDLPPRHAPNQTLNNLRFLLANEHTDFIPSIQAANRMRPIDKPPHIKRIEKYFVLNRLVAPSHIANIRALLAEFKVPANRILEIPFEWEEYALRSLRWDGGVSDVTHVWGIGRVPDVSDGQALVEQDVTNRTLSAVESMDILPAQHNKRRKKAENIGRLRAIDFTFHDKNLYAINNNGGRNFALNHGRSLGYARWVLPLDGNCFFTPAAMMSLVDTLDGHGEGPASKKHVTIPMSRLLDNAVILPNNTLGPTLANMPQPEQWRPIAPEEPQVGFRFDSNEDFQEAMRYGRRSKLEFLWRLGAVPRSRNLDKRTLPWEQSDRDHLTEETFASIKTKVADVHEAGFMSAGWTYRLFSGEPSMEINTPESNSLRNMNRIRGIVSHLERLDESIIRGKLCGGEQEDCGFHKDLTFTWDSRFLHELRQDFRSSQEDVIDRVKALTLISNEVLMRAESDYSNSTNEDALSDAAALALSAYLTDDLELAYKASDLFNRYLLDRVDLAKVQELAHQWHPSAIPEDGDCYLFPLILPAGISPALWVRLLSRPETEQLLPYNPNTFRPAVMLDALRLLQTLPMKGEHHLSRDALDTIASLHLAWLLSDPSQMRLSHFPQSTESALEYDYQIAALAAYLGDVKLLARVRNRGHLRYPSRSLPTGLRAALSNVRILDGQYADAQDVFDTADFNTI